MKALLMLIPIAVAVFQRYIFEWKGQLKQLQLRYGGHHEKWLNNELKRKL